MGKRVLVLDDAIGVLEAIETALNYEGFEIKTLDRTYNIFKNIQDFNPDLIVDFAFGAASGAELHKQFKSNRETKHLPVITGYKANFDLLGGGCSLFISKSFDLAELYLGINKVLSGNKPCYTS